MKKIIVVSFLSFLSVAGSSRNDLDTGAKKIFNTILRIAKTSEQGRFEELKPQVNNLVKTNVGYEIIIKGGIPSYLVTPAGYTPLIGTVWGNLDDITQRIMTRFDLCEIKEKSSLTLWVGGQRYSVGPAREAKL